MYLGNMNVNMIIYNHIVSEASLIIYSLRSEIVGAKLKCPIFSVLAHIFWCFSLVNSTLDCVDLKINYFRSKNL